MVFEGCVVLHMGESVDWTSMSSFVNYLANSLVVQSTSQAGYLARLDCPRNAHRSQLCRIVQYEGCTLVYRKQDNLASMTSTDILDNLAFHRAAF